MSHVPQGYGPHARVAYERNYYTLAPEPVWLVAMNTPYLTLFWVTVLAIHNVDQSRKRFAGMPVWAASVLDASRAENVVGAMERLIRDVDPGQWFEEVRVYWCYGEGAENLPAILARIDGTDVPEWNGAE